MSKVLKGLAIGCGFTRPHIWGRLAAWVFAAVLWAVGVALLSVPISARADDGAANWTVAEVSGQARARADVNDPWHEVELNEVLGPSAEVHTGPDGKAVLVHMGSRMDIAADSRVALPSSESMAAGAYRILQRLGNVLYRVKDRVPGMKRFEVETPYLAAVVKGTTFTVDASSDGGMVNVVEGIVGVDNMHGIGSVTITAGQSARVGAAPGSELKVSRKPGDGGVKEPEKTDAPAKKNGGSKRAQAALETKGGKATVVIAAESTAVEAIMQRHPKAVPIFTANSGKGIFAKGVTIETAFADGADGKKGSGNGNAHGLQPAGGTVSDVARADKADKSGAGGSDNGNSNGNSGSGNGGGDIAVASTGGGLAIGGSNGNGNGMGGSDAGGAGIGGGDANGSGNGNGLANGGNAGLGGGGANSGAPLGGADLGGGNSGSNSGGLGGGTSLGGGSSGSNAGGLGGGTSHGGGSGSNGGGLGGSSGSSSGASGGGGLGGGSALGGGSGGLGGGNANAGSNGNAGGNGNGKGKG